VFHRAAQRHGRCSQGRARGGIGGKLLPRDARGRWSRGLSTVPGSEFVCEGWAVGMTGEPETAAGVDAERLALCLSVIAEVEALPAEHPDAVAVRRATAGLFKTVKLKRRRDRRDAILAADRAVTEATATGAPGRIDDETAG